MSPRRSRPLTLWILVLCALALACERAGPSCRRAWWDLRMVAVAPINIPLEVGQAVARDMSSPPWVLLQIRGLTWTPLFTLARHGAYTVFHTVDLLAFPLYLPFGPEPYCLYETDTFPFPLDRDAEREFWTDIGLGLGGLASVVIKGGLLVGSLLAPLISLGAVL